MEHGEFDPQYLVTLDELYHPHWAARKRRRIGFLREVFQQTWPVGHPTRLIQITGTNGKGSVAHYLAQGLGFSGVTGTWTGPHVFDYAERFHINGRIVDHDQIKAVYREKLAPLQAQFCERHPGESLSFAELGILLSLHLFQRNEAAWAVMEVGAGGRYTPLMALPMDACVLTNVGADHPKTLGDKLWQRCLEKAGIARPNVPFFSSATGEALPYVKAAAEAEGARFVQVETSHINQVNQLLQRPAPNFEKTNLALALRVIQHFYPQQLAEDLLSRMTGRLTARFSDVADNLIVDVAHNPDKCAKLAESLKKRFPQRKFHFLLGLTRERDPLAVFGPLLELADHITFTSASYAGRSPFELRDLIADHFDNVSAHADPVEALAQARAACGPDQILVLTGSAYMIDQALNSNSYIRHTNATFGRRGPSAI